MKKKNRIIADMNTPICHLRYAKGWTGRLTAWVLRVILKFGGKKNIGTVIMGAYNLPLRNITRMTGGSVSWSQLNGLVTMFNGKFKALKSKHPFVNSITKRTPSLLLSSRIVVTPSSLPSSQSLSISFTRSSLDTL